jgi:hypothetical protein
MIAALENNPTSLIKSQNAGQKGGPKVPNPCKMIGCASARIRRFLQPSKRNTVPLSGFRKIPDRLLAYQNGANRFEPHTQVIRTQQNWPPFRQASASSPGIAINVHTLVVNQSSDGTCRSVQNAEIRAGGPVRWVDHGAREGGWLKGGEARGPASAFGSGPTHS